MLKRTKTNEKTLKKSEYFLLLFIFFFAFIISLIFFFFSIRVVLALTSPQKIRDVQMLYPLDKIHHKNVHMACMLNNYRALHLRHHVKKMHVLGSIALIPVLNINRLRHMKQLQNI